MIRNSIQLCILSLLLWIAMPAMAQNKEIETFEGGQGTWTSVACGMEWVENPAPAGLNLSCSTLLITRAPGCDNWSGAMTNLSSPISGYRYVHVLMYRNNTNLPNLKVYDPTEQDGSADLKPITNIVANKWQDVVFDVGNHTINFIFLMVYRTNLTQDAWMYVDDIVLSNDPTPRTTANTACKTTTPDPSTPEPSDGEYELVWNEDFTDGSLDRKVWNIEVNGDGGGNNELQYYCEKGVKLAAEPTTGKQCLVLTATKEQYNGKTCTSGRVNTKNNLYYTYGKIEARIKFPNTANGLWPAFWQMGNDFDQVGWPRCGETDIIELGHVDGIKKGTQDRYFNGAMHLGSAWNTVWSDAQSTTHPYSVEDTFHIITMEWTPTSITMYMDKEAHPEVKPYFRATLESNDDAYYNRELVFGKPNFIIANLAIGGNFPQIWDINKITALANGPRSMYIDWIRIYQKGDAKETFHSPSPSDPIEGATTDLQQIQTSSAPCKQMINGQLVIIHDGRQYNILGQSF